MKHRSQLTDEELVLGAREGSEADFNELVDRYTSIVYGMAFGITASAQEAEEIVQETFLKLFKNLDRFSPDKASFKTWLLTIARNQSINAFKSIKRRAARFFSYAQSAANKSVSEEDLYDPDQQDSESLLRTKQEIVGVQEALKKLPERQRTALMLKVHENMSYSQIAAIMDVSASSVESLIFRARKNLLELLETEH